MDRETLIAIAKLARGRAAMQDNTRLMDGRDGMQRVGAKRALDQLAVDLEVMADHVGDED